MFSRELRRISYPGIIGLGFLAAIAGTSGAEAQQCPSDPAFEVASVKPVEPVQVARQRIDSGRVIYPYITLGALIVRAYSLKGYQLDGPSWLRNAQYEINAKIPDGCSTRELRAMLRHLLHERFGLEVHEESRNQPVLALLVDRNGPNLKKSATTIPESASTVSFRISSSGV
jgi:Protein of unknown function (DUF3738).